MPGYSMYPALDVGPSFNPLQSYQAVQDFQTKQTLLPGAIQNAQDQSALAHTDYGNSMLSQAATEALASDPDEAPQIWDQEMNKLAQAGNPVASQYIGRYRQDLAEKVQSAFSGGKGGGPAGVAAGAGQQPIDAQTQAALYAMPADQRQKSLANMNMAINGFSSVHDQQSWNAELDKLRQAGIPVDKFITSTEYSPLNYQTAYRAIQKMTPMRDALMQVETAEALGAPMAAPAPIKMQKGEFLVDPITHKVVANTPEPYQFKSVGETGGNPGVFNPNTGAAAPLSTDTNQGYAPLAGQLIASESGGNPGAQNPQPGQTSGGLGGMTNATYVAQARKLVPALVNASDAQILAMKKNGTLNGLNTDLVMNQNREDAAGITAGGHVPTTASVAMAYKLGLPDALKVLNAQPNTPLDQILSPNVMKVNPQLKGQTAGTYAATLAQQFGNDPLGGTPQNIFGGASKSDKYDKPVTVSYTDKNGNDVQVLAQQDQKTGQWTTADENRTPIKPPNNDMVIVPSATGGGRTGMQITRSLTDAKDAAVDLGNIVGLPISANTGIFGMRSSHGDGSLMGSAWSVLGNKMTTQEQQDLNATMVGIGKSLAGLQTGGAAGAGGKALMDQYEKLGIQPGDTYFTAMRKLGAMRQYTINAAEANMASSFVNPQQKRQFQDTIDAVKKSIPWTPADVTSYERAAKNDKSLTFSDYAAKNHLGGATPSHIPSAAVDLLKSNPSMRQAFDQKYGAGSSSRVLGGQ